MADREIDQCERDRGADHLEDRLGAAGPLEHEPHDGNEADDNADAGELAHAGTAFASRRAAACCGRPAFST